MRETVHVEEHDTERLTLPSGWVFWRVKSGCIRVQKGDFTAYLQHDEADDLARLLGDTRSDGALLRIAKQGLQNIIDKTEAKDEYGPCGCHQYAKGTLGLLNDSEGGA